MSSVDKKHLDVSVLHHIFFCVGCAKGLGWDSESCLNLDFLLSSPAKTMAWC